MDKRKRTSIVGGAVLILVGGLLFAAQILPDFMPDFWKIISWPWSTLLLCCRKSPTGNAPSRKSKEPSNRAGFWPFPNCC